MGEIKPDIETFAKIKVIGVGGSGNSVVNRMVYKKIRGVDFLAINTDVQALHASKAPIKLHIGKTVTRGLGAGMNPEIGKQAAEESQNEIRDLLKGADMVFITCGLGGGTGSGASPIVAEIARDLGALTIGVVTKPFSFEGAQRQNIAEEALNNLSQKVDAIIVIPNDKLLETVDKKASLLDAFSVSDDVLHKGVKGISELITVPGLINVDFADVKAIMSNAGASLMGIGEGKGEGKAVAAAKMAIENSLIDLSIEGAKGVLFTITGGPDLTMHEVNEAARLITDSVDPQAKIIFGANIDEELKDMVKITVIATGFSDGFSSLSNGSFLETEFQRQAAPAPTPASAPEPREAREPERKKERVLEFPQERIKSEVEELEDEEEDDSRQDDELDIPAFLRRKIEK